ncbi:AbrB family transcriptional regulator [Thermosynechococcus sp. GLH187]|uniref:AbrB family transcriptional regulator n=1 Tax=unclassified Thermosynechococcus TaxID=2622553 RepID=UPI00197CDC59|nr:MULTISPECIES: AbrB family transcriptional regulator [unclassified Thermosynechococcus]QSF49160.1 AbrB family transcriptional regulator [Thermosynechococcus sp. TA-1]WNC22227.1 AbrB family transcriptional regulator [Thermosynechococcus sp. PP22]WNC45074.1 AbrB family transcriptional regulator [Thermosynechococcus sp. GLH187]WNC47610.1 AbrB family transcriptional regulator [Thermosynechococcus sp. GLH333]WNC50147.1 AbrB family transcriptional regulator [Thermosynechococcus sp. GLH87]
MEKPKPLTGKALLQRLSELGSASRKEAAKLCGYYRVTKSGEVRVNLGKFYEAVLAAGGLEVQSSEKDVNGQSGRGRSPSYRVKVHQNGQIVIGSAYTKAMNLKPGDTFKIKQGYKHIHLYLIDPEEVDGAPTE